MTPDQNLSALQERLGYRFRDPGLLMRALTHPSYLHDHPEVAENNQRLEFLGDAVLQLLLTERLFALFPADREGGLTRRRAMLGKGRFLSRLAREAGLDACLLMSANEDGAGGRTRDAALEDAFEAMVGALYLDGGMDTVRTAVPPIYGDLNARLQELDSGENPKGRLQEMIQPVHGNAALRYEVLRTGGADHAREFEVAAYLNGRAVGTGRGSSKKVAEEHAAREALATLTAEASTPVQTRPPPTSTSPTPSPTPPPQCAPDVAADHESGGLADPGAGG